MEKTAFEKLAELQMEKTAYKYLKRLQKKVLRFGPDSEQGKEALDELQRLTAQIRKRHQETPRLTRLSNKVRDRRSDANFQFSNRQRSDYSRYGVDEDGYKFNRKHNKNKNLNRYLHRGMESDAYRIKSTSARYVPDEVREGIRKKRDEQLMADYIPNIFGDEDFDEVKEYNKELVKRRREARISRRKEKRDKKRQFDDRGRQLADTGVYLNFAEKRNLPHDVGSPLTRVPEGLERMENRLRGLQQSQFDSRQAGEGLHPLDFDKDRIEAMQEYDHVLGKPVKFGEVTPGAELAERIKARRPKSKRMERSPYYNRRTEYVDPLEELADQETIDLLNTEPIIEGMDKIKQPEIPTLSEPTRTVGGDVAKKKRGNLALGLGIPALAGGAYLYSKKKKKSRKEKDQMKAAGLYDHLTK